MHDGLAPLTVSELRKFLYKSHLHVCTGATLTYSSISYFVSYKGTYTTDVQVVVLLQQLHAIKTV